ncbi:cytochrome P450 [Diaporthe sp. PMI_573]|nr:cytochrome P450 [Diaporthaceae sp. PMI_573]
MGLIFLFFIILYLLITRFRTRSRLSAFSGPFFASISYLPILQIRLSGRSYLEYFKLSKKYGSIVRISPNNLLASNPDYLHQMSTAHTTANTIKITISHITASPSVASELQNKLNRAAAKGLISQPLTDKEATKLLYLDTVVTKGLRVNPPFGRLIIKQVGPKGDTFNSQFIPPGTRIRHSTWDIAHNVSLFGTDADVFWPERWLEADRKTRSLMCKQTDLVFGAGRWGCPARAVACIKAILLKITNAKNIKRFFI